MPELPEVETTRRGLAPHLQGRRVHGVILRRADLRWPIPPEVAELLPGQRIEDIRRRAKYLLLDTAIGSAVLHLGMSGSLRVLPGDTQLRAHDHVDISLDNGRLLRFNDPRRFGSLLWQPAGEIHPLLQGWARSRWTMPSTGTTCSPAAARSAPVKTFLMDQAVVVGVGNIYAAESLFKAGISPLREAGKISRERYQRLAGAVKEILGYAITRGGTTLRDFISPDGAPGYFEQELLVYGRDGLPCPNCGRALKHATIGQRASVWCSHCQR